MRKLVILCFFLILTSCNSSLEKVTTNKKTPFVFDVYEPSEMSLLMNHMVGVNDTIREKILEGENLIEFPEEFLTIYTAELTETKYRSEIFEAYSKVFVDNEKAIFDPNNEVPLVEKYNNAINTCLACHKTECVGPIPKIRKLLIN